MVELDKLKQEKSETEEARKTAEEQIESMRKDHEEKVIILFCLYGVCNSNSNMSDCSKWVRQFPTIFGILLEHLIQTFRIILQRFPVSSEVC